MTKTINWLSIFIISTILLTSSIITDPIAFADDDDGDDDGDDDKKGKKVKTLESECAKKLEKKKLNFDGLVCQAIFGIQLTVDSFFDIFVELEDTANIECAEGEHVVGTGESGELICAPIPEIQELQDQIDTLQSNIDFLAESLEACSSNGVFNDITNSCDCDPGFTGQFCQIEELACENGQFDEQTQTCSCDEGWGGVLCDVPIITPAQCNVPEAFHLDQCLTACFDSQDALSCLQDCTDPVSQSCAASTDSLLECSLESCLPELISQNEADIRQCQQDFCSVDYDLVFGLLGEPMCQVDADCISLPNSAVQCTPGQECQYTCDAGFADVNNDLNFLNSDGCETDVVSDSDGDGLTDFDESNIYGTDPSIPDTDSDGLTDGDEVNIYGTEPVIIDTDGDGLTDGDEIANGTDPLDFDTDNDGLTNFDEINTYGTDPTNTDSDFDGLSDGNEVNIYGTNPAIPDLDSDGLSDGDEVNIYGTDPKTFDTDNDELSDGDEVNIYGTDPLNPDTDFDGLTDGDEVNIHGTDPLNPDTDGDGITDGSEVLVGTDPLTP